MAKVTVSVGLAGLAGLTYYKLAGPESQFEIMSALGPALRIMDPETSHNMGIMAAKWGLFPKVENDFGPWMWNGTHDRMPCMMHQNAL